jgi:parallel beta-helix repeat protein/predicted outer membrane repeat protein
MDGGVMSQQIQQHVWLCGLICSALSADGAARAQSVLYVDHDATGPYNGSSWCEALLSLQHALAAAEASGGTITEISVANGTYFPDEGHGTTGDRTLRFDLLSGVALRGGYAGCGAVDPDARDFVAFETILSGDLCRDDEPAFVNNGDNTYHVLFADGTDEATVVDGFTVTGGNANATLVPNINGGGLRIATYTYLTVLNTTFHANHGTKGGAVYNTGVSTFIDCTFSGNEAAVEGGAIYENWMIRNVTGCRFFDNAAERGGAIYIYITDPAITACTFGGNQARAGGAIFIKGAHGSCSFSQPWMVGCTFLGNTAIGNGGAIEADEDSDPTLINCQFSGNTAGWFGGAVHSDTTCHWDAVNCTFSGNTADRRTGGLYSLSETVDVRNCVFWENSDPDGMIESSQFYIDGFSGHPSTLNYSCVQGLTDWHGGVGNLAYDPLFGDPSGPDGIVGTVDDDLHLSPGSRCINAGDPDATGLPEEDLDGDERVQHCRPDMGIDETPLFYDCNTNGNPDVCDILDETSEDCTANNIPDECEPDCNNSNTADSCDIADGISSDCNENEIPDECDLVTGISEDCNVNDILDECELAGIRVFYDRFREDTFDPQRWPWVSAAVIFAQKHHSPPYCARIHQSGHIDTCTIDLSEALSVRVVYYLRNHGTDAGDDLIVKYWADEEWQELVVHPGTPYLSEWQMSSIELPLEARHADFQLRFRGTGSDSYDYWFIDDVEIIVSTPDCNGTGTPDECESFGDFDLSGRVDLRDFARFQACFTGEGPAERDPGCCFFDAEQDLDVDLEDFAAFLTAFQAP